MVIKVDEEGKAIIRQLCDIALKHSGIQNFDAVGAILSSMSEYKEPKNKKENKDD